MPLIPEKLRRRKADGSLTLVEHLEELRTRLIIAIAAIGVGAIAGWFLFGPVMTLLRDPYCAALNNIPKSSRPPTGCNFIVTGVLDPIVIKLKIVVFLGLFIALPIVLYQLWAFIVPGLTERERRMAIPFVFSSTALFALGGLLAYWVMPKGLGFLLGFAGSGITPFVTADKFVTFVLLLTLAFGLSFEFPIVLIFLTAVGILSSARLREWRRGAIVSIAIFAAVITPSNDPYTMLAMGIPMYLFYEASILVARLMKK